MALLLAVGLSAAGGGCATMATPAPETWTQESWSIGNTEGRLITTRHFAIHSTLHDKEFEAALPGFLETAYRQYASLIPPDPGRLERLPTYVFQHRQEWERFAAQQFPNRFGVYRRIMAGGFTEQDQCVAYYIKRTYTLSVLAHEGLHQYVAANCPARLPAWLNEGLATYCESFELPGDDRVAFTPRRNSYRLNAIREALQGGSILPLTEILATDAGEVIVEGQSVKTRTYYAQAWALTCYLRHEAGGRYSGGFEQLLQDLASGDVATMAQAAKIRAPEPARTSYGEAVFRAYISEDIAEVQAGFERFLYDLAGFRRAEG